MLPYSSVPHDRTDAYKAYKFSGFVDSHPPDGNTSFLFFYYTFLLVCVHRLDFLHNFGR